MLSDGRHVEGRAEVRIVPVRLTSPTRRKAWRTKKGMLTIITTRQDLRIIQTNGMKLDELVQQVTAAAVAELMLPSREVLRATASTKGTLTIRIRPDVVSITERAYRFAGTAGIDLARELDLAFASGEVKTRIPVGLRHIAISVGTHDTHISVV